jgi:hypothetical protein
MKKQVLALVMMSCMTAATFAAGQEQAIANPGPARPDASATAVNAATTVEGSPANANADPLPASPVVATTPKTRNKHADSKNKQSQMRPDDPAKSPWWEPRDWNYIAQQGS